MTALEFMGWKITEDWEDCTSYFEKEDGSTGFIKAIPHKKWHGGEWIEDRDDWEHKFYIESDMSRCPLTWREIQEFSRIQVECKRDMHCDIFDTYPCYRVIGKAASKEEIDGMSTRSSWLCTFEEDGWEPEIYYSWKYRVMEGYFSGLVEEDGRVAQWWQGIDGMVCHEGNVPYKRIDIQSMLHQWCHLLAACPGIDLVMGMADFYSYFRYEEDDEEKLEEKFLENSKFGVRACQNKVELIDGEEFRKLYRNYKKAMGMKRK